MAKKINSNLFAGTNAEQSNDVEVPTSSRNDGNTVLSAVCWVFGHKYKVTRRITKNIAELQCPRCKKEFGINTTTQALLPMDDELKSLHRELSNCC